MLTKNNVVYYPNNIVMLFKFIAFPMLLILSSCEEGTKACSEDRNLSHL